MGFLSYNEIQNLPESSRTLEFINYARHYKLRFDTQNATVYVDDLCNLNIKELDILAIELDDLIKQITINSWLISCSNTPHILKMKSEIIKYISKELKSKTQL